MNRRQRRALARDAVKRHGLRGADKQAAVRELARHLAAPEGQAPPMLEQPRKRTLMQRASGLVVPTDE